MTVAPDQWKIDAMAAFWAKAGPKGRCRLADLEVSLPEKYEPEPGEDGLVGRETFLAWVFGKPEGSVSLLSELLSARGFALINKSEGEPKGLDLLWPSGNEQMTEVDPELASEFFVEKTLRQFCDKGPSSVPGQHLLAIVSAGLDPNNIPFPRPKHMEVPKRRPSNAGAATLPDQTPFLLPRPCKEVADDSNSGNVAEAECTQEWASGLAKHADELRPAVYEGTPLDTDLEPWPQLLMDAVARDECTESQLQVVASRESRGPLSDAQQRRRRAALARKLQREGDEEPPAFNERIFLDVLPELEKKEALEQMRIRWAQDAERAVTARDELAELGSQYCAWPVPGERRWPPVDAAWKSRGKWLAMWREKQEMQRRSGEMVVPGPQTLNRSSSACSDASWLAVSDISWIDIESRASESGWEAVVGDSEPSLQEAKQSLDSLSKSDLTEVKSFSKPPVEVKKVINAVCVLFGLDASWEMGKTLLGDACFLQNLIRVGELNISQSVLLKLERYIADDAFVPDHVKRSSKAAAGICIFIRNVYKYNTLKMAAEQAQPGIWKPTKEEVVAAQMPGLQEAAEATKGLQVSDLQELRKLRTPTPGILKILEATQYLLACVHPKIAVFPTGSARKATWGSCMQMISDEGSFLACLHDLKQAMDDGRVLQANVRRARTASNSPLTCNPTVFRDGVSASLAQYNIGMIKYFDGLVAIDPSIGLEFKAPVPAEAQTEYILKRSDVQELKSLQKPPHGVDEAVVAVVLLAGMVEDVPDWKCCCKLMANPQEFIKRVEELGKDASHDEKALSEVRKIAAQEDFTVEKMKRKSAAAACMVRKVLQVLAEADAVAAASGA